MRIAALTLGIITLSTAVGAQDTTRLRGTVVASTGPVASANVFLLETLDGTTTDSAGRFSIATAHSGSATLVVKSSGYVELRRSIRLPLAEPLVVRLGRGAVTLAPTTVIASRYAASDERGATLTTIDVVSTPGTNADVMRAIQTLPGVQMVDEGTALFVRGGDYLESHTLVNDAVLHTAFSYESPNATFVGTVDPFLLDGIHFSSGGFGARHGNALSGIAALTTLGLPQRNSYSATVGLAALSASGAARVGKNAGVRAATNQFDTDLMFRVNGSTVQFATPPRGYDRSGSLHWRYRPTGELKLFGIAQRTSLASTLEDPSYVGDYALDLNGHLVVLNWRDVMGSWSPSARASDSRMRRIQEYGAFRLETGQRFSAGSVQLDWAPLAALTMRAGAEWERSWTDLEGSLPEHAYDRKPGARVTTVAGHPERDRTGLFIESDVVVGARTRLVVGARSDRATNTGRTVDPRASAAVTIAPGLVLTGAWGVYHQVPDPLLADSALGDPTLPPMRATHAIVGAQAGSSGRMLRVELWSKRYRELAQMTRDYEVRGDGTGTSRGADLFASGRGPGGMRWRVALSTLRADRTDPNTNQLARSPFDVTHSVTTVVNQPITRSLHLGVTHRYATGRPFTPVVGATRDDSLDVWVPRYASPTSERLPAFARIDIGLTHLRRLGERSAVFFASVNNVFDRDNVHAYRYSSDYATRIPIRSLFNRSFYAGVSVSK